MVTESRTTTIETIHRQLERMSDEQLRSLKNWIEYWNGEDDWEPSGQDWYRLSEEALGRAWNSTEGRRGLAEPAVGDIVSIRFPYAELQGNKMRPSLVLAILPHDDLLVCQITTRGQGNPLAIALEPGDFLGQPLDRQSYVWPDRVTVVAKAVLASPGVRSQRNLSDGWLHSSARSWELPDGPDPRTADHCRPPRRGRSRPRSVLE